MLRARGVIDPSLPALARPYLSLGIERYAYPPPSEIPLASARAVRNA